MIQTQVVSKNSRLYIIQIKSSKLLFMSIVFFLYKYVYLPQTGKYGKPKFIYCLKNNSICMTHFSEFSIKYFRIIYSIQYGRYKQIHTIKILDNYKATIHQKQ